MQTYIVRQFKRKKVKSGMLINLIIGPVHKRKAFCSAQEQNAFWVDFEQISPLFLLSETRGSTGRYG